jgi:hypothetical protein
LVELENWKWLRKSKRFSSFLKLNNLGRFSVNIDQLHSSNKTNEIDNANYYSINNLQIIFEKIDGEKLAIDFCWWDATRRLEKNISNQHVELSVIIIIYWI